jgi:D-tyrosyl-tRNA(Tyr) deacylase
MSQITIALIVVSVCVALLIPACKESDAQDERIRQALKKSPVDEIYKTPVDEHGIVCYARRHYDNLSCIKVTP